MELRTLYLQSYLSINGRGALDGRVLLDRFRQLSEETLLGHLVLHDDKAATFKDPRLKDDIVSHSVLRDLRPNIVFVEGGLFADSNGWWKIPEDIATEVCREGGILIVADADLNELHFHKEHYLKAGRFFKARVDYGSDDSDFPVYGGDETRFWRSHRQILCDPTRMVISRWIRPIYDGIPEILVGNPVQVASYESLVASCNNNTTGTLHLDYWVDQRNPCPFASAAQVGSGFVVLIAGLVSSDLWLQGCPHNPIWLTNLAAFLAEQATADHGRRLSHRRSPHLLFLSHRSTNKGIVEKIAGAIKQGGINVWLDKEELVPSQSLTAEISRALGKMTHFVLFWSSSCVGAAWVERELNSAIALLIEKAIPLLIVRLDQTPVPNIVADLYRIEGLDETEQAIGERIVEAVKSLARKRDA